MEIEEAYKLFDKHKGLYLLDIPPKDNPTAYILGGQPSSGKGSLPSRILSNNVLIVNGDLYRVHHPEYNQIIRDPIRFSEKTQILSNIFTESLIQEAISNRLDVAIEGTMRRPEIVLSTIQKFKKAGFKVEALAISAPKEFTEINLFYRYYKDVEERGYGRLSDLNSHDQAVKGLLNTLDAIYHQRLADRITIYNMFGKDILADYKNESGNWIGSEDSPSNVVVSSRRKQLSSIEDNLSFLSRGTKALLSVADNPELVGTLSRAISNISGNIETLSRIDISESNYQKIIELEDEIERITYSSQALRDRNLPEIWSEITIYNNRRQKELGDLARKVSISQAISMVLDERSYVINGDSLLAKSGHLFVNGVSYLSDNYEDNIQQTSRLKR